MTQEQLKKFSIICLIISIIIFAVNYFFFHFVTDEGITFVFHEEAGKPFVANLIGILATLFLFSSAISFIIYLLRKNSK